MKPVTLQIESAYESKTVSLDEELSIGRTAQASLQLNDEGLSRVNTTIFRDGGEVLIVDENSTNGTFINGNRVSNSPQVLFDGDEITLGSYTKIRVSFSAKSAPDADSSKGKGEKQSAPEPDSTVKNIKPSNILPETVEADSPIILFVAAGSTFLIILFAVVGLIFANWYESGPSKTGPQVATNSKVIPLRVIDPFGKQTPQDLDDLIQYWEVPEKDVTAEDLDFKGANSDGSEEAEYFKVTIEFWKQQRAKALANPVGPTGIWPPGLKVPAILRGDGVVKQTAKIREMQAAGYQMPLGFADLAKKRNEKLLVELPMATNYWVLEVGGSSTTGPFTLFDFAANAGSPPAPVGSPDFNIMANLANNFSGEKYDVNDGAHRRQMKIRLLRMFNPRAKAALEEIAKHYYEKFNKPLRVTSLSRSMQYQMELNKVNANSYRGGPGRLPPHTSGCAFDLARKHMGAEEQNYLMAKLEEMEKRGILDALIEGNVNACFHVFVYEDGLPPKGY